MSDKTKAQNLARIRDNQRRSRARRKEYLQELEAKLRSCDQVGVEVSAEIQTAARRVLDENKKLRSLLHERGVSESEIRAFIGGSADKSCNRASSAPALNALLERKITCNGSTDSISSTSASHAPRTPNVPPLAIPAQRTVVLNNDDTPSPHSGVSSTDTQPEYSHISFYATPVTPPAPEVKNEDIPYNYPYDSHTYNAPWTFTNADSYATEPEPLYNSSSCVDAANIIRNMRSDVGPELESDLGCRAPNQNCMVNNSVVFNMIDKYDAHQQNLM